MRRRKFLKAAGSGLVLFGSGLIGVPIGACRKDLEGQGGQNRGPGDLDGIDPEDLDRLLAEAEMSEEEAADFMAQIDRAGAELQGERDLRGRPRVPPGQHVVQSLPVLGRNSRSTSTSQWTFAVTGEVSQPLEFDWEQFEALPKVDLTTDIHCVTGWSMLDTRWQGIPVRHLLELAQVNDRGRFIVFDCEEEYTTNIPLDEALKENVLIATGLFGAPLPREYGGLARSLVPDLYFYKSGKWVRGIRVLEEDEPGYWEVRGYSNTADPWTEERYG